MARTKKYHHCPILLDYPQRLDVGVTLIVLMHPYHSTEIIPFDCTPPVASTIYSIFFCAHYLLYNVKMK